jgi:hypothetical protein
MTNYSFQTALASLVVLCVFPASAFGKSELIKVVEPEVSNGPAVWKRANLTMHNVPSDFNHYYCLVGLSAKEAINLVGSRNSFTVNESDFFPMAVGPYDQTLLEVQYTKDHKTVLRFRFVERIGDTVKDGKYSSWQTKDIEPKVRNYDRRYSNANCLTVANEKFDIQKWLHGIQLNKRTAETWDLLHSYQLMGMTRENVQKVLGPSSPHPNGQRSDNIEYYQISARGCVLPEPIWYLEFKYFNGRVCAFRTENVTLMPNADAIVNPDRRRDYLERGSRHLIPLDSTLIGPRENGAFRQQRLPPDIIEDNLDKRQIYGGRKAVEDFIHGKSESLIGIDADTNF